MEIIPRAAAFDFTRGVMSRSGHGLHRWTESGECFTFLEHSTRSQNIFIHFMTLFCRFSVSHSGMPGHQDSNRAHGNLSGWRNLLATSVSHVSTYPHALAQLRTRWLSNLCQSATRSLILIIKAIINDMLELAFCFCFIIFSLIFEPALLFFYNHNNKHDES